MDDSDTEGKIYKGLALMHSREKSSTKKLRMMLDSFIAKKCGPEQTLESRIPRNFLKKVESCQQIPQVLSEVDSSSVDSEIFSDGVDEILLMPIKIRSESEDSLDMDEVPRISIPDEGFGDGALCLVCNGSNLGPFILLECHNCEEVYHPLCHQPPVTEIDIYDPELIWFCGNCTQTDKKKN
ncbi:integrator complex subunit 12-like [Belonocnema kinseyi]|uniref:integrator complex subunit 12-like n=1 Tax=Belonocnema kinseyi TaxID=2817044 RepID=UPI00143D50C1|nr:integrator complex subunit 12-like [Belonocnema kinseyi]